MITKQMFPNKLQWNFSNESIDHSFLHTFKHLIKLMRINQWDEISIFAAWKSVFHIHTVAYVNEIKWIESNWNQHYLKINSVESANWCVNQYNQIFRPNCSHMRLHFFAVCFCFSVAWLWFFMRFFLSLFLVFGVISLFYFLIFFLHL